MLDLVLRGGRVCDGSGGSAHDADVGIEAGRVVAIGRLDGAARRTLDVRGLIVAPGFVDVHTHYDAQVTWDRLCTPSCWHGVTSVVIGNCGFALAPCRPSDRERMLRMLEHVEGMPFESLHAGIAWEWESFAEYVRALGARPLGVNVGALLGHSALRAYVMGDGAYTRAARAGEVETMAALVREGMVAGALGFATSRSPAHVGEGGRPVPSRQARRARRWHRARLHSWRGAHGPRRVDGGVPRRRPRAGGGDPRPLSRACPSPGRPACSRLACSTSPASPSVTGARSSSTTSPGACPTARGSGSPARDRKSVV